MAGYLLDTNVISEIPRRTAAPEVEAWVDARDARDLFISAVTIGELTRGIYRLPIGRKRQRFQTWLDNDLARQFLGRVLPFEQLTAEIWGRLLGEAIRRGQSRPAIDTQIAATAIQHNLSLVTRNVSDFTNLDLEVIDPWES